MNELQNQVITSNLLKDELDKISIDQLHKVVLQFSNNCYESKKLCATILIPASVLISLISKGQLNASFFVGGFLITVFFWFLDSYNYFYQEKLRIEMKNRMDEISRRNKLNLFETDVGAPLSKNREKRKSFERIIKSFFNLSMSFYFLILLLDLLLLTLYLMGYIHSLGTSENFK